MDGLAESNGQRRDDGNDLTSPVSLECGDLGFDETIQPL